MKITKNILYYVLLLPVIILSSVIQSTAQNKIEPQIMSLQDCIQFGLSHNPGVQKSKLEIDKADKKINS